MYEEKKHDFVETNEETSHFDDDILSQEEEQEAKTSRRKRKKEFVSKEEYEKMQEQFTKALNTAAHHENLSKYYRSEYEKMIKYRSQPLLEVILPTLDGFQLAFKYDAPTKEAQNYRVGFEFVYKLLLSALTSEGMSEIIPKVGDVYDPQTCQVVDTEETNEEADVEKITDVLLSGYKFKDRIVRPANVKIYVLKNKEKIDEADEAFDEETQTNSKEMKN